MSQFAAVVLAGGAARRMGGVAKPLLRVGGRPMLARVLDATAAARRRIVVGPPELGPALPAGVLRVQEEPPGGGPVAAIAVAVPMLPADGSHVAVISGDLPFLTPAVLSGLAQRLADAGDADLAVLLDESGARQWLCSMWRRSALERRLAAIGAADGARVRDLVGDAEVRDMVIAVRSGPPPWFDCDTDSDIRQAEEWIDADP
jgi:molybdopterin-guanine dinucleotide biosynthesis protein A